MMSDVLDLIISFYDNVDDFITIANDYLEELYKRDSLKNKDVNDLIERMKSMVIRGTTDE